MFKPVPTSQINYFLVNLEFELLKELIFAFVKSEFTGSKLITENCISFFSKCSRLTFSIDLLSFKEVNLEVGMQISFEVNDQFTITYSEANLLYSYFIYQLSNYIKQRIEQ